MKKISYLLAGLAMMTMSSPAYAVAPAATIDALIDIKFTPSVPLDPKYQFSGSAVIGNSGDYWNNILPDDNSGAVSTRLLNTGGLLPGGNFTFTSESLGLIGKSSTSFKGTAYATLMNTYVYTYGTTDFMTIGGLSVNTNYDVYVLTQGSKTDNTGVLTLTGTNVLGSTQTFTQSGISNGTLSSFQPGQNYMLETFKTDARGNLTFGYAAATPGKVAMINGLQIAASSNNGPGPTPEPASMLLIGVGGALISAARLRKKKSADNPVA